jgi:hypothetical protein
MPTSARLALLIAVPVLALAACGGGHTTTAASTAKLPPQTVCDQYNQQMLWLTYLSDPSPVDIATLDHDVASDASSSSDASLATALRSLAHLGEVIASGDDPVAYEAPVSNICANYP